MKGYEFEFMPVYLDAVERSNTIGSMSAAAEGIYWRLIRKQWLNESIPGDEDRCRTLARATAQEWKQFREFFESEFPLGDDGQRRNPQSATRRETAIAKIDKLRENGGKGGRPPGVSKPNGNQKAKQKKTNEKPNGLQPGLEDGSESGSQVESIKELSNDNSPKSPEGTFGSFDGFLTALASAYPENNGRKIPDSVQKKLKLVWKSDGIKIVAGAVNYGKHRAFLQAKKRFCPQVRMISTWFNQGDYNNEYEMGEAPTAADPKGKGDPVKGVDFDLHHDEVLNEIIRVKFGTTEPFSESEWRQAA